MYSNHVGPIKCQGDTSDKEFKAEVVKVACIILQNKLKEKAAACDVWFIFV